MNIPKGMPEFFRGVRCCIPDPGRPDIYAYRFEQLGKVDFEIRVWLEYGNDYCAWRVLPYITATQQSPGDSYEASDADFTPTLEKAWKWVEAKILQRWAEEALIMKKTVERVAVLQRLIQHFGEPEAPDFWSRLNAPDAPTESDVGFHICIVSQTTGCTWSDAGNFITTGKPPAEQPTMWERLDE